MRNCGFALKAQHRIPYSNRMTKDNQNRAAELLAAYTVGDSDVRPWGSYTVVAVGINENDEEFCEKEIVVSPQQILSLQSHDHRREHWIVKQGTLTVVLDGERLTLKKGESVRIPLKGVHCMANLGSGDVVVKEIQSGICREEDIRRYFDAYGRGTEAADDEKTKASLAVYKEILDELKKG